MNRSRTWSSVALLCLVAALPTAPLMAQAPAALNVTGKWIFSVTSDAGTGTPTVTLTQKGDSLTGHYSSQALGERELKGSVKNDKITFALATEIQGTALTVTYAGTIEDTNTMKGTVDFGGYGGGTFTAKRQ